MSLMSLTALELGRRIQTREVSAVEAVRDALCRISKVEKNLNCFVTVDEEGALLRAQKADEKIQRGESPGRCTGGNERQSVYKGN